MAHMIGIRNSATFSGHLVFFNGACFGAYGANVLWHKGRVTCEGVFGGHHGQFQFLSFEFQISSSFIHYPRVFEFDRLPNSKFIFSLSPNFQVMGSKFRVQQLTNYGPIPPHVTNPFARWDICTICIDGDLH